MSQNSFFSLSFIAWVASVVLLNYHFSFSYCTLDKLIYLSARVLVAAELMISVGGGEVDQASPLLPLGGWFSGWASPLLCLRSYLLSVCGWLFVSYMLAHEGLWGLDYTM